MPTNTGYTTSWSEAVRLTHIHLSNHCSFVLLWTTNSRRTLHLGHSVTFTLVVLWCQMIQSFIQWASFIKQTRHKDTSNLDRFYGSQSVVAFCCSLFLAVCANLQRSRQPMCDRCAPPSPGSPFFTLIPDVRHSSTFDSVVLWWSAHIHAHKHSDISVHTHNNNRRQIFHS